MQQPGPLLTAHTCRNAGRTQKLTGREPSQEQMKPGQRSLGVLMLDHLLLHPLIQLFLNLQDQQTCQALCLADCVLQRCHAAGCYTAAPRSTVQGSHAAL